MILVKPSIEYLQMTPKPLTAIERAGRICYKSEDKITSRSAQPFVQMLYDRGHYAMLEHASIAYMTVCDRGVSHEFVRHRLFSFSQESTRYCNYYGGVCYVLPLWLDDKLVPGKTVLCHKVVKYSNGSEIALDKLDDKSRTWITACAQSEENYIGLIEAGWSPQQARSVLIHSLKTEIVITGNLRQWIHFFRLRCSKAAHPQMQEIAKLIFKDIQDRIPDFDWNGIL